MIVRLSYMMLACSNVKGNDTKLVPVNAQIFHVTCLQCVDILLKDKRRFAFARTHIHLYIGVLSNFFSGRFKIFLKNK
jgi:uncharacterized membrane protein